MSTGSASSGHDGDVDLESQQMVISSNPPRDPWRWIFFIIQVRILISRRAHKTKKGNSLSVETLLLSSSSSYTVITNDDKGDIADSQITSPRVSIEVHLDGENDNDYAMSNAERQHANIAKMVKEKNLDSLQNFGGIRVIAEALGTDLEKGIPGEEHLCCWRIASGHSTRQTPAPGFLHFLSESINNYTILLLFLSAVLSLGFGIKEEGPRTGWFEGLVIIFAIIILVVGPAIRDFWLKNVQKLSEKHRPLEVNVFRGGYEKQVSISDVFLGDIVCLKSENVVPADGLFISGEFLKLDDGLELINDNNPFLFHGAMVTEGTGRMLVTSVGKNTTLGELMNKVSHDPNKIKFAVELDKVSRGTQITGLVLSILILVGLFLRFMFRKEDVHAGPPEFKGKPIESKELLDVIKRIVMKPNGKISTLTTSLTMLLVGVMEGVPFLIALAIGYCNKKTLSNKAFAQEPLACVTMGSVTTICIDRRHRTGCGEADMCCIVTRLDIEDCKKAGVDIKLISEGNVSDLKAIAIECGLLANNSDRLVLEGEEFRNYTNEERMDKVDKISVMGNSHPSDKLLLVQCLKDNGRVVAMVGFRTNESPALKEADVGIAMGTCSCKTARESSDIIIYDSNFSFWVAIIRRGRHTYHNIRKYIQLELCMNISGLLITSITTMSFGFSPITALQLLSSNFVVAFLGGLALLTEPPREELTNEPRRRTEPLITKAMWINIVAQALSQTSILLIFQFKGQAIHGISEKISKTIIFNSFVLWQVFNLVNAREPEKKNVFRGIHQNLWFWVAVGGIMVLQVAYIEIAHILVHNARLNWWQWFVCLLIGMVSWAVNWATKFTSGYITDWLTRLPGSHIRTTMAPSADSGSTSNLELPLINGNSTSVPS